MMHIIAYVEHLVKGPMDKQIASKQNSYKMLQTQTGKHDVDRNIKQADSEFKMIMQKNANMAYHEITGNQI